MIRVGDWVWPKLESKVRLVSGHSGEDGRGEWDYHFARVVSLDPFVLESQYGGMKWLRQDINEYERIM